MLLYSSVVCGGIHLVYPSQLVVHRVAMISGVMTSIWNHGTTSPIAKWTDRGMMIVAAIVHVRMYHHYLPIMYCIVAYLLAKIVPDKTAGNAIHASTHVVATIYNLRILSR